MQILKAAFIPSRNRATTNPTEATRSWYRSLHWSGTLYYFTQQTWKQLIPIKEESMLKLFNKGH